MPGLFSHVGPMMAAMPALIWCGVQNQQDHPAENFSARKEVQDYASERDFLTWYRTPERWQGGLSSAQRKEILIELLDQLRSIRERKFDDPADVTVWSRLKSGKMRFHGHGMIFKQDIFLENGRCAWAIEEMLGCKLPEYSEESCNAEEKINKLIDQSYRVILQAMSMPERKKEKPAARQPEQQGEKKFRPKVLDQLPMTLNLWRAGLPVLAVHSNRVLKDHDRTGWYCPAGGMILSLPRRP